MKYDCDIVICGIGGQGVLTACSLIANVAANNGVKVKFTELMGLGQRGGSVVGHVRMGDKSVSPIIAPASADIVCAFEITEALRWSRFAGPDGTIISSDRYLAPNSGFLGIEHRLAEHPEDLLGKLPFQTYKVNDCLFLPREKRLATNIFFMGIMSTLLPFEPDAWLAAINRLLPKSTEASLEVFEIGEEAAKKIFAPAIGATKPSAKEVDIC